MGAIIVVLVVGLIVSDLKCEGKKLFSFIIRVLKPDVCFAMMGSVNLVDDEACNAIIL